MGVSLPDILMNPFYCKHAKVKGEDPSWHYACELTGQPIDDHLCMCCEERDAPEGLPEDAEV